MLRILLVQPERIFLNVFARTLRGRGYEVFVADNHREALNSIYANGADLVLCRFLVGPSSNDLDMIRDMRCNDEEVPIIVASNAGLDRVPEIMDAGGSLVVASSRHGQDVADLVDRIAQCLTVERTGVLRDKAAASVASEFRNWLTPASMADAVNLN